MSDPPCQDDPMKLNHLYWFTKHEEEIIARFGDARLIRHLDGQHELVGGTPDDLVAAREWCSLYARDLVFSCAVRRKSATSFAA